VGRPAFEPLEERSLLSEAGSAIVSGPLAERLRARLALTEQRMSLFHREAGESPSPPRSTGTEAPVSRPFPQGDLFDRAFRAGLFPSPRRSTPIGPPISRPRPASGMTPVLREVVFREVDGRQVRLDVYLPAGNAPEGGRPVVLALFGGGWWRGSKEDIGPFAAQLTRSGYVVVTPDYALARPGTPSWPTNFEDVREAVRWTRRNADRLGADPERIAALGESSGAHLALLLGTAPDGPVTIEGLPADSLGGPGAGDVSARVQAVVSLAGPADLLTLVSASRPSVPVLDQFLGGLSGDVPGRFDAASPARHASADDPPVLLLHGAADPIVPAEQARQMASALGSVGVPHRLAILPGVGHDLRGASNGGRLMPTIVAFLSRVFDGG
jgi:acetyl esterase/lipase